MAQLPSGVRAAALLLLLLSVSLLVVTGATASSPAAPAAAAPAAQEASFAAARVKTVGGSAPGADDGYAAYIARAEALAASWLQTSATWSAEHGFCELCIYAVHQVQYGQLPSCGGSAKSYSFSACSQVVQSMLAYAHDVMHLISYGCYKYDPYKGWQTIRPCPAHVICGRLTNIYDLEKQAHCPADFHYRFPNALGNLSPQANNPLAQFAAAQATNPSAPTMFKPAPGGAVEPPKRDPAAFPSPATASTVEQTVYGQVTSNVQPTAPSSEGTAESKLRDMLSRLLDDKLRDLAAAQASSPASAPQAIQTAASTTTELVMDDGQTVLQVDDQALGGQALGDVVVVEDAAPEVVEVQPSDLQELQEAQMEAAQPVQ